MHALIYLPTPGATHALFASCFVTRTHMHFQAHTYTHTRMHSLYFKDISCYPRLASVPRHYANSLLYKPIYKDSGHVYISPLSVHEKSRTAPQNRNEQK